MKKDLSEPHLPGSDDNQLGLENASFKWNEVVDAGGDKSKDKDATNGSRNGATDEDITVVDSGEMDASTDHRFELRDISVMFPPNQLTLITGPTASGKTALLVSSPVSFKRH